MALDEALLESVQRCFSPPVLRLYRWQPATVSIGYFQKGSEVVNPDACRNLGLDLVRRITGGRAVLHEKEVTYAVISPEKNPLFPGEILGNYNVIAELLQQVVESFGITASLAPVRNSDFDRQGVQHSACFTAPSGYELIYQGCKLTGSAQKRQGGVFLQHGSIPVDLDIKRLFLALNTDEGKSVAEGANILGRKVGWLNRWLPSPISIDAVEERLISLCAERWKIHFHHDSLSTGEMARARTLMAEKYGNPVWVLKGIE